MATAAELRARRDALTAQRSSGVARVSYDGKTVDYRSVAEIDRALEALDREIAAAEGRRIIRQVRVTTAKGLGAMRIFDRFRRRPPAVPRLRHQPFQCRAQSVLPSYFPAEPRRRSCRVALLCAA